jgi:signal transduction histidine kinase
MEACSREITHRGEATVCMFFVQRSAALQRVVWRASDREIAMLTLAPGDRRVFKAKSSGLRQPPRRVDTTSLNRDRRGALEQLGTDKELPAHNLPENVPGKAGSEFDQAARIAHEVNQPLSAIVLNGETCLRWLDRDEPDVAKARELTKRVIADARRASEIIERVQTSTIGSRSRYTPLPFNEIVEQSIHFLHHEFQSRNVVVSLDLSPDIPMVFGDRIQLQQVVVNLAVNAIHAVMGSTGSRAVLVRTELCAPKMVRCSVEDNGPGIEPAHLPHIFGNFFTTKDNGMGLGLPISKSIVETHGGRIEAGNSSVLGGARFSFLLPANPAD